ncbi:M50 family metallopeptidase [Nocardioides sp. TRM66260-LWL]|uniref:M50 family metallopeptidase n=1 Tax=Nocardioides sp. TRM66260-LWL TaxID=2874478 RepID=UPI001CC39BC8|nr:M50 family metallopeptidase [Nocardioides sp. TRM66260-LWL]MBZ5734547.1 M50 family metallopeptidase [Nocardioides sp. TRM66260-LWL]
MTVAEVLGRVVDDLGRTVPVPDAATVLGTGAVAVLLVLAPATWPRVRLGVTVVHEAGHAVAAVLVGRRLAGLRVHQDTSGLTLSRGRPRGPGMVAMLAAGYAAPALLGVAAATALAAGRPLLLLWGLTLLAALLLPWVRNLYGLAVVALLVVGLGAVAWAAPLDARVAAAYLLAWTLLLAAPRPLVELARAGRRRWAGSDVRQLADLTPLPAGAWLTLLLLGSLAGLAVGVATLAPTLLARMG